ncbi:YqcC family protein [Enterobacter ludwigii]|uniref:YqcC family protein n=1 Tax=Enterobacter ludwigii TaxID=299767 RepID=UPI002026680E|nr:YqcC family protein [Enterobacter ludwigii]MCL9631696.1 YqcC family protein [Enterobacter ludwigii]MED5696666.1 YqcC family protein [Enterobacter ludwigii]HDU8903200.1 YqcC family protein [Enterobacter ludwigii]
MTQHDSVRARLHAIEALLRQHQLWQETAPQPEAFASTQPFCLDTLAPFEWLQWVLIPRMHALLDGGHPLPQAFAVAPYYEMALDATHPARDVMLIELEKLDALFAGEDA